MAAMAPRRSVHPVAVEGFAEADLYERARTAHPDTAGPEEVLLPDRVDCRWLERR
jgi:hypothetical protein